MALTPSPIGPRHPRRHGIRSLHELGQALRQLLYNGIYIIAFILVIAGIFKLTDFLLIALIDPPAVYRTLIDVPLAVFTGIQFLRQQEALLVLLERSEENDEDVLRLPAEEGSPESTQHP